MKKMIAITIMLLIVLLAACGSGDETEETEELAVLDVEFNVPGTAEPGEAVQLEAIVTYGGEAVEDADEVEFEYWVKGNEDDSIKVEGNHTESGSYVAEVTFQEEAVYEIYAHTTARGLHTMPLTSITVGDGGERIEAEAADHGHHEQTEGFHLHFVKPEEVTTEEVTDLVVHLQINGEALENANVRFEISPEGSPEQTEWVDAEETAAGEYAAAHEFSEAGTYTMVIHVEDDADLHEHEEYTIEVE